MVEVARRGRIPTGLFIRQYLLEHGEAHPSEIHRALREEYYLVNQGRRRKEKIRPPTFQSFMRYMGQMRYFGLVEFSGREESIEKSEVPWLSEGTVRYYRLSDRGKMTPLAEEWVNWRKVWLERGYPAT
jgi:hypothetical protein